MSIRIVRTLDERRWRRYVSEHPQGSVFHTPEMFRVFSRTKRYQPEIWAACIGDDIVALLLPVRIALTDGPLGGLTARAVAHGSVLYGPGPEGEKGLELLLGEYAAETSGARLLTELRNLADLGAVQHLLEGQGFRHEGHLNYLVDLQPSAEAVFERIGPRTRKNIRRALRQGQVTIEIVSERRQVAACYALLRSTYKSARVPLAHPSLLEAAFDVLYPEGMARFALASVGSTPVAVSIDLLYKDVIFGWYGGVDRAYSAYGPGELLMWDILRWGAQNGYRVYDLGGAGKPDEEYGVRDFKAKFGGSLVNYGRNTFVHAPRLLALSTRVYQLARGMLFS